MDHRDEAAIRKWHDRLEQDVRIRLLLTKDPRSVRFSEFADRFAALAPKVHTVREDGGPGEMPALRLGENIRYHALPSGKELGPFLAAAAQAPTNSASGIPAPDAVREIKLPTHLELYIAVHCAFCPAVVRSLLSLVFACPLIRLSVVDAALFNERAQARGIRSVPTVLFEDTYRWTGNPDVAELVDMMARRDPANLRTSTLENMIKEGDAGHVAEMMLAHGQIFSAFLPLLFHETWPVRLGAMVVMEELVEKNVDLLASAADTLWERAQTVDDPIRGDIYYILGQVGDETLIPKLKTVLSGSSGKELKEAAEEAIARIVERHAP